MNPADDEALTDFICEYLARIPGWEYRPSGPRYTKSEVGIYYGAIDAEPDRAVGVRVYGVDDNDLQHTHERRAQIRFRGARGSGAGADRLARIAYDVLNGLSRVGGISGIRRFSMVPHGADDNGREERTDNYRIILDNPEAIQ